MKESTRGLIDNLLVSVPIEINYRDELFLKETVSYQPNMRQSKKASFNDIKREIINNNSIAKLRELEHIYISRHTDRAVGCDRFLSDRFLDDIADAFIDFSDEIQKEMKKSSWKKDYLAKAAGSKKICCLVYEDGRQVPYQYDTLNTLLDTIAKVSICYCIGSDDYIDFDNLPDKRSSSDKYVPMFIRRICALICYFILRLGNYVSIIKHSKQLPYHSGVCKQIMTDLHSRCIKLGYSYFGDKGDVFQYDKWSIYPEKMLRDRSYVPPKMPFTYLGMKEGYLGYMIARLQEQVPYKKFIDVFGGSGAASVQFRHNADADYYINDYDFCIVSYYRVMRNRNRLVYKEFIEKLNCLNTLYLKAYDTTYDVIRHALRAGKEYLPIRHDMEKEFYCFSDPIYNFYNILSSISKVPQNKTILSIPLGSCTELIKGVISLTGTDIIQTIDEIRKEYSSKFSMKNIKEYGKKNVSYIDAAVLFAYFAFHTRREIIVSQVYDDTIMNRTRVTDFNYFFESLRSEFKDIEVIDLNGATAMDILADAKYNDIDTLAYIDSPYIGTASYSINKKQRISDSKSKIKSSSITVENVGTDFYEIDFDMKALLQSCQGYNGKYIFSCRVNMKKDDLVTLNERKCIGQNSTIRLRLNNYIWFWSHWKKTGNYVLFMYDEDLNISDEVITNVREVSLNSRVQSVNEKVIAYIYNYVYSVISKDENTNLEVMITNFDFDTPNFQSIYERGIKGEGYIYNNYRKRTDAVFKIPDNGAFIKMPVKDMAEIVLTAAKIFVNKL